MLQGIDGWDRLISQCLVTAIQTKCQFKFVNIAHQWLVSVTEHMRYYGSPSAHLNIIVSHNMCILWQPIICGSACQYYGDASCVE
jgi:hypothetical protein